MRIAIAQINTTIGDFEGNVTRIVEACVGRDVSLVLFPELSICGYMPRDLLRQPSFLDACEAALARLAATEGLPPIVVGAPVRAEGPGKPLLNAAVLIRNGERTVVGKRLLPTYDVFDERRYFRPGAPSKPIDIDGTRVGLTVCEDIWLGEEYPGDPVADLVAAGAELILNISASPFLKDKAEARRAAAGRHVARHHVPFALCNLVGANDQLVFDGNSFAFDREGGLCAHAAGFEEEILEVDFGRRMEPPEPDTADELRDAIVLGIRDYLAKTGFGDALIGMSGGIDSSLVAALAADALGPDHVTGVGMPGPFSASHSLEDARELAERLGIRFHEVPIRAAYDRMIEDLRAVWGDDKEFGLAEENLQARLRGTVLMSLSNQTGALVLVPSNKSEFAMGYATLYGDMVGALAPIADLYKGEVYAVARRCYDLPARILDRPPSAELRPDQTDQDSLPPYEILDEILRLHLEERRRPSEIAAAGFDPETVRFVLRCVARSEYKRQQGAPVLKLTRKAFGLGRRVPITERFKGGVD
jgi:NAD+ synthetase